jgi:hypothetical protein
MKLLRHPTTLKRIGMARFKIQSGGNEVKLNLLLVLLFCSLFLSLPLANAQSGDVSIGFGTVHDKATGSGIDTNTLESCSPSTDTTCAPTPHLSGFMLGFNGNYMFSKHFGAGAEVSFQPSQQKFVVLTPESVANGGGENIQSRITFYDFNGVYQPVKNKLAAVQVFGGLGGTNQRFYDNITILSAIGNSSSSTVLVTDNHFQLHAGIGVPFYFKHNFFIRPQFDIHYVPNFSQYSSDVVTQGMIWVGYTFGQ